MNKNLDDYVKVYRSAISPELCKYVVSELEQHTFNKHQFHSHISGQSNHVGNDCDVLPDTELSRPVIQNEDMMKSVWSALNNYIVDGLKFPWFCSWGGFSPPKYMRYEVDAEMKNHCDHIHDLFTDQRGVPVLSIIGLLSDEFTGGDLVMFEDSPQNLKLGDVIVFPSNFLYPHAIKPILSGQRYSFASWAW